MDTITRTLSMKFGTDDGKAKSISLTPCKDNLLAEDVMEAMDTMIDRQIFKFGLAVKAGATVTERNVTKLF
ncbi:MAG: DUF2922 domain-containing protein [Synergistaceae bacterium]|jgi:hypothetical protein|nr:DUF2922 domain-containing protein [Synergistaceae bacterium]